MQKITSKCSNVAAFIDIRISAYGARLAVYSIGKILSKENQFLENEETMHK